MGRRHGQAVKTFVGHTGAVGNVAFSPDGATLASESWSEIFLWDTASGELLQMLNGNTSSVSSLAFSPDGDTLAGGSSKEIHLWDVDTGNHLQTFTGHAGSVSSVAFNNDGDTLASASWDGTVLLWEITPSTGVGIGVEPLESRLTTLGNIKRTALLQIIPIRSTPKPGSRISWQTMQL